MVTEPIFASLANILGRFDNITKAPNELKDLVDYFFTICHVSDCACVCVIPHEYLT